MATTSPAQIEANRANAQLSTGPRTVEGKSNSSKNATRHGLTACGLIVLPGLEEIFNELEAGLRTSLRPFGRLQETIFLRILESAWNLNRCRLAEAQLYSSSTDETIDPLLDDQNEAKYARIHKYAKQNENSLQRALSQLGDLQTERQFRHEVEPLTEEQIADPAQVEQTPHSLSEVCRFRELTASVSRHARDETRRIQIEAKAQIDAFYIPPVSKHGPVTQKVEAQAAA